MQQQAPNRFSSRDQRALVLLGCTFCFLYVYFFQGGGWNQNSHFDTVRALVERHSLEITAFASNTGDVGYHDGKIYANKGPGLALWAAPCYFFVYHLERLTGLDANPFLQRNLNGHILTFIASGLPAVALVLVLFLHFRRKGGTTRESLCLAGGFGAGSLIFPYSGVMMSHVFTACTLFTAWHLVSETNARRARLFAGGVLTGLSVMTDLLATPIALLFLIYTAWRHSRQKLLGFLAGAGLIAALFLLYNQIAFGSIWKTHQTLEAHQFQTPGLVLGMLEAPQWRRLYWLTFHPYRGLFHCSPLMLVPLFSVTRTRSSWALEQTVPLCVIAICVLFNLGFNGWTGGWCVGPRYLIPMLPFMFSFALTAYRRWPAPCVAAIVLSTLSMLSIAATQLMVPGPNGGVAPARDPVWSALLNMLAGRISTSAQSMVDLRPTSSAQATWASYNLGELAGLNGVASVLPPTLALVAFAGACLAFSSTACAGSLRSALSPKPH